MQRKLHEVSRFLLLALFATVGVFTAHSQVNPVSIEHLTIADAAQQDLPSPLPNGAALSALLQPSEAHFALQAQAGSPRVEVDDSRFSTKVKKNEDGSIEVSIEPVTAARASMTCSPGTITLTYTPTGPGTFDMKDNNATTSMAMIVTSLLANPNAQTSFSQTVSTVPLPGSATPGDVVQLDVGLYCPDGTLYLTATLPLISIQDNPVPGPVPVACSSGTNQVMWENEFDNFTNFAGSIGGVPGEFGISTAGTPNTFTGPSGPSSGSGYIFYESSSTVADPVAFFGPIVDLTAVDPVQSNLGLRMDVARIGLDIGQFLVGYFDVATSTPVALYAANSFSDLPSTSTEWRTLQIDYTAAAGKVVALFVQYNPKPLSSAGPRRGDIAFDKVQLIGCADLCSPVTFTATESTSTPGDIFVNITSPTQNATSYDFELRPMGGAPGSGFTIPNINGTAFSVPGQPRGASYDAYITKNCGGIGQSNTAGPVRVDLVSPYDDCSTAYALPVQPIGNTCGSGAVQGLTTVAASGAGGVLASCPDYNPNEVWVDVTLPATGRVQLISGETSLAQPHITRMAALDGCSGALLACSDASGNLGQGLSSMYVTGTPGANLKVAIWTIAGAPESPLVVCALEREIQVASVANCGSTYTKLVDGSGVPAVVEFLDAAGNLFVEIDNNVNLGTVTVTPYEWTGGPNRSVPIGSQQDHYAYRQYAINPQFNLPATVSLAYTQADLDALLARSPLANSLAELSFVRVQGTTCSSAFGGTGAEPRLPVVASTLSGGYKLTSAVPGFSEFFVFPITVPLPVELISFDVRRKGSSNVVTWATATEKDNAHFVLEHALEDASSFSELTRVAGNATTLTRNDYAFEHAFAKPGTHYYRLQQVDLDGSTTPSKVIAVEVLANGATDLGLVPNPSLGQVLIQGLESNAEVSILDATGREVLRTRTQPGSRLATDQLPQGMYMVRIARANGVVSTLRLIRE